MAAKPTLEFTAYDQLQDERASDLAARVSKLEKAVTVLANQPMPVPAPPLPEPSIWSILASMFFGKKPR